MDRRQRKTREAIFRAFTRLLARKSLSRITVGEIITEADVGRATFYDHFPTKDDLWKELCQELFCHVFDAVDPEGSDHRHIFACDAREPIFLHLLRHLQQNDNQIITLLQGSNGDLVLAYFQLGLSRLVKARYEDLCRGKPNEVPEDLWCSHMVSTFLNTLKWWRTSAPQTSVETVYRYFCQTVGI